MPSSEPRPDPSRVDKAASVPTFAAESWVTEPRPENPYRTVHARMSPPGAAWDEGFAACRAAFDAVVAEAEHRKGSAKLLVDELARTRAERDAALAAGQKLADLVTLLGGYDGPGYLAAPNQGERPDYVAAARLFSKIMRDETNGAAAALAAWRAVSGSSEPRKETT